MQGKNNLNLGRNLGLPFRFLWLDPLACILRRSMNHPIEAFLQLKSASLQIDSILPQPCQLPQGEFTHLFFKENNLISSTINNFSACGDVSTLTPLPNFNQKYFWSAVQACSPSATPFTSISATCFSRQMVPPPPSSPWRPANTMPSHPCHLPLVTNPVPSHMADYSLLLLSKKIHCTSTPAPRSPGQTNGDGDQRGGARPSYGGFLTFQPI